MGKPTWAGITLRSFAANSWLTLSGEVQTLRPFLGLVASRLSLVGPGGPANSSRDGAPLLSSKQSTQQRQPRRGPLSMLYPTHSTLPPA
jgi:hypothetical protein